MIMNQTKYDSSKKQNFNVFGRSLNIYVISIFSLIIHSNILSAQINNNLNTKWPLNTIAEFQNYVKNLNQTIESDTTVKIQKYYNYKSHYDTIERTDIELNEEIIFYKKNNLILNTYLIVHSESGDWLFTIDSYFNEKGELIGQVDYLLEYNHGCETQDISTPYHITSYNLRTNNGTITNTQVQDSELKTLQNMECLTSRMDLIQNSRVFQEVENCNAFEHSLQNLLKSEQLYEVSKNDITEFRTKQLKLSRISKNGWELDLTKNNKTTGDYEIHATDHIIYKASLLESYPYGHSFVRLFENNNIYMSGNFSNLFDGLFQLITINNFDRFIKNDLGSIAISKGTIQSLQVRDHVSNQEVSFHNDGNDFIFTRQVKNQVNQYKDNISLSKFKIKEPVTINSELQTPQNFIDIRITDNLKFEILNSSDFSQFLESNSALQLFFIHHNIEPLRIFSSPSILYIEFAEFNITIPKVHKVAERELFQYNEITEFYPDITSTMAQIEDVKNLLCGRLIEDIMSEYETLKSQYYSQHKNAIKNNDYIIDFICANSKLDSELNNQYGVIEMNPKELVELSTKIKATENRIRTLQTNHIINEKVCCPVPKYEIFNVPEFVLTKFDVRTLIDNQDKELRSVLLNGAPYVLTIDTSYVHFSELGKNSLINIELMLNIKLYGEKFNYIIKIYNSNSNKISYTVCKFKGNKPLTKVTLNNVGDLTLKRDAYEFENDEWQIQSKKGKLVTVDYLNDFTCYDKYFDFFNPKKTAIKFKVDQDIFLTKILQLTEE
jgi:hypothetical protein